MSAEESAFEQRQAHAGSRHSRRGFRLGIGVLPPRGIGPIRCRSDSRRCGPQFVGLRLPRRAVLCCRSQAASLMALPLGGAATTESFRHSKNRAVLTTCRVRIEDGNDGLNAHKVAGSGSLMPPIAHTDSVTGRDRWWSVCVLQLTC
jgi:hypothetical protein